MCAEFSRSSPEWLDGPFTALDPDNVTTLMDTWYRGVMKAYLNPKHSALNPQPSTLNPQPPTPEP